MTDTKSENKMADDPQIRVVDLRNDISLMRMSGFWPDNVECGPIIFDFIIGLALITNQMPKTDYWDEERRFARDEKIRDGILSGVARVEFEGMPVMLHYDVPDGRLWPQRERGGMVAKPFFGTEAYLAT